MSAAALTYDQAVAAQPGATWVPMGRLDHVQRRLDQMNARAVKRGMAPLDVIVGELVYLEVGRHPATDAVQLGGFYPVVVTSDWPTIGGWKLAGVLDCTLTEPVIVQVPGVDADIVPLRNSRGRCDHCRTGRQRHETFALVHEGGDLCIVGRNCLRDFLGADPSAFLASLAYLREVQEAGEDWESGFGGGRVDAVRMEPFLAAVASCARVDGWVSRRKAREGGFRLVATADNAWRLLTWAVKTHDDEVWFREHAITDVDRVRGERSLAWARDLDPEQDELYLSNLGRLCRSEVVPSKWSSFVASAVTAYERHVEGAERARVEAEARGPSEYLAAPGGRLAGLDVEVFAVRSFSGQWGPTTLVLMRVAGTGNVIQWWATGSVDLNRDGAYRLVRATVKRHDVRDGEKRTVVVRCKLEPAAGTEGGE